MAQDVSGESTWRRSRVVQAVPAPAAGADWSIAVPGGHLWRVLAVRAVLTTSAAVANRAVRLELGDGTNPFLSLPVPAVQAASLAGILTWAGEGAGYALGVDQLAPLPEVYLVAGWTIGSVTRLIDVGDAWSAVRLWLLDETERRGRLDLDAGPDDAETVAVEAGLPAV